MQGNDKMNEYEFKFKFEKGFKPDGWKDLGVYECPICKVQREGINCSENNIICYDCDNKFEKIEDFKIVKYKVPYIKCKCKFKIEITPSNKCKSMYVCFRMGCQKNVAIQYKNCIYNPQTIMKIKWNKSLLKRADKIDKLYFTICKTEKDFIIADYIQDLAKREDNSFMFMQRDVSKMGLLFDNKEIIGYIVWSKLATENLIRLNQMYIVPHKRKQGMATLLMKYWFEENSKKYDEIAVESPNTISQKILIKLGYVKVEGDQIIGLKCTFFHGL